MNIIVIVFPRCLILAFNMLFVLLKFAVILLFIKNVSLDTTCKSQKMLSFFFTSQLKSRMSLDLHSLVHRAEMKFFKNHKATFKCEVEQQLFYY